jgi:hypothetical protein
MTLQYAPSGRSRPGLRSRSLCEEGDRIGVRILGQRGGLSRAVAAAVLVKFGCGFGLSTCPISTLSTGWCVLRRSYPQLCSQRPNGRPCRSPQDHRRPARTAQTMISPGPLRRRRPQSVCGGGLSVLAKRSLLNPPSDKPNTRVREAYLISHRNGDV